MSDDYFLLERTANVLRLNPEKLAIRVSREHYLWLADEIVKAKRAAFDAELRLGLIDILVPR